MRLFCLRLGAAQPLLCVHTMSQTASVICRRFIWDCEVEVKVDVHQSLRCTLAVPFWLTSATKHDAGRCAVVKCLSGSKRPFLALKNCSRSLRVYWWSDTDWGMVLNARDREGLWQTVVHRKRNARSTPSPIHSATRCGVDATDRYGSKSGVTRIPQRRLAQKIPSVHLISTRWLQRNGQPLSSTTRAASRHPSLQQLHVRHSEGLSHEGGTAAPARDPSAIGCT